MGRALTVLLALVFSVPLAAAPAVRLPDLDNHPVDPFLAAENSKAIVFMFAAVECPISNRYAPVVQRLYQTFAAQGVRSPPIPTRRIRRRHSRYVKAPTTWRTCCAIPPRTWSR